MNVRLAEDRPAFGRRLPHDVRLFHGGTEHRGADDGTGLVGRSAGLAELDFRGVKVDSCVACGGMFLDKGEADKAMAFKEPGWLGRAVMNFFGAESDLDSKED